MDYIKFLSPWIQTTNDCNLRCSYCFVDKKQEIMEDYIYKKSIDYFINALGSGRTDYIKLRISGGEPLLVFDRWKKHIGRFLEYTKRYNCGGVEILTNMTILPNGFIEYIKRYDNLGINISLDGMTYSKPYINGSTSSYDVIENLEWVQEYKDIFLMTVITENGKYLSEIANYVNDNMKWEVQFNKYYEKTDIDLTIENIKKMLDILYIKGFDIKNNLLFNYCDMRTERMCSAGYFMFYIDCDGSIYDCQMQTGFKSLTNIMNNDLIEKLGKNKKKIEINKCNDCSIYKYCHGDCPFLNNEKRKEYFCPIMKEYFIYAGNLIIKGEKNAKSLYA